MSGRTLKSILFVFLIVLAGAAHATIVVYTNQALFLAAIGAPGTDNFAGFSTTDATPSPVNRQAGTYDYTASSPGDFFGAGTIADPWFSTNNATDTITFSALPANVRGIGGNFFGSDLDGVFASGDVRLTVTDASGTVTRTILGATTSSFLGFVSDGALTQLTLASIQPASGFLWPTTEDLIMGVVLPGPATHFSVTAPASATAGAAFSITVTARDASNAVASNYTGTVHFTSNDPAAVLPANVTLTNGIGTFSATLKSAGTRTITATDVVTASINGTTSGIAVGPASAIRFSVSAPASATAGSGFNVTVTALDSFNNTVAGYAGTVHFASTDVAAALPADSTLTNGVGTFPLTLKTSGNQTITATDTVAGSISGTSGNVAVNPGTSTHFSVNAPVAAVAGTPFNIVVTALDAFNNIGASYAGVVHFASSDVAAALPANSTLTNGVGTFSATLNTFGIQTITATDTVTGSINGTSGVIAVGGVNAPPVLVSVKSSKTHGTAGTFGLPLAATPLNPSTEPRIGPTQTIVFTFDKPVTAGIASTSEGAATVGAPTFSGNDMTVPLAGVTNAQYVTVNVNGVLASDGGGGGTGSIRVGFLFGDVNQTRQVTVADVGTVNAALLQTVTAANFLLDVNVDGKLTVADKGLVNSNLLVKLPLP